MEVELREHIEGGDGTCVGELRQAPGARCSVLFHLSGRIASTLHPTTNSTPLCSPTD